MRDKAHNGMTRRDAGWLIARAIASGAVCGPFPHLAAAAKNSEVEPGNADNHSHAAPDPHDWANYTPQFFTREEFGILDCFTAILIPSDETPGAREAHVPAFIDFVVNAAAEYEPEVQKEWRDALRWLQDQGFGQMSEEAQTLLITDMSAPESTPTKSHAGYEVYRLIKDMTVHAFYTSRPGMIDALEYKGLAYLTEFPACTHPEHRQV